MSISRLTDRVRRNPRWRRGRAAWRDTWLLLREFQWPLLAFAAVIAGGGLLYDHLAHCAGEPIGGPVEGMYHVLCLTFLQPIEDFPRAWYLQVFFFAMPVIGAVILAQGVADFGAMVFNRRARGKEWEMAVASTFNEHVILVGLGHLGFRVARHVYDMGQDLAVIELNPKADLLNAVRGWGVPVIEDNAARDSVLEAAGVRHARSIVLCTQNDSLNLQIALKARALNPDIRVIIRIFDHDFASALHEQFGFRALSATSMAAPVFAAAAAGAEITGPITVEGQALSLARLEVEAHSPLVDATVADIEARFDVSVVLIRRAGESDLHPAPDRVLCADDVLAVLGGPAEVAKLTRAATE